jgi:hypothetical protein
MVALVIVGFFVLALPLQLQGTGHAQARSPLPLSPPGRAAAPAQNSPSAPAYDEQVGASFEGNYTSLSYNVTVLAQSDANGYGPGYILNGFTAQDYFYQVSVSYNWPEPGPFPGFGFGYDVFGPASAPVFPTSGGSGLENFSAAVNSGDKVLLSLAFSNGMVVMSARDWNTSASAQTSFSSEGSTEFIGSSSSRINFQGYFTGLMTEWYHEVPYAGEEKGVTYSSSSIALPSAWMWLDEFDTVPSGGVVYTNYTQVTMTDLRTIHPYYVDGVFMSISPMQFTTGIPITATTSTVTLSPALKEKAPTFVADFTLAGQPQQIHIPSGTTTIPSDAATPIQIQLVPAQTPLEKWAFSDPSGSQVTIEAGANASFIVYHLAREFASYQVAQGGGPIPASSAPILTFKVPPPVASSTVGVATKSIQLTTTPVEIYALLGTQASVNQTISGGQGMRWEASSQQWDITTGGLLPFPVEYYQQFQISLSYSTAGGGPMPIPPEFTAASTGVLTSVPLSKTPTQAWFDAGTAYSFTGIVVGPTGTERWVPSSPAIQGASVVSAIGEGFSQEYTQQFLTAIYINDAKGGSVYNGSGWLNQGDTLVLSASPSQGWLFEGWNGSGSGSYTGTNRYEGIQVQGPLKETATFYVQLMITADKGTNIGYSYGSQSGTVGAGTSKLLAVPPSNVTLQASSSLFIYSFAHWQGPGPAQVKGSSMVLSVDSPTAVAATSTYDYAGVFVLVSGAAAIAINATVGSMAMRNRWKKSNLAS